MRKSARNTRSYNVLKTTKPWKHSGGKRKYEKTSFCINCVPFQTPHSNAGKNGCNEIIVYSRLFIPQLLPAQPGWAWSHSVKPCRAALEFLPENKDLITPMDLEPKSSLWPHFSWRLCVITQSSGWAWQLLAISSYGCVGAWLVPWPGAAQLWGANHPASPLQCNAKKHKFNSILEPNYLHRIMMANPLMVVEDCCPRSMANLCIFGDKNVGKWAWNAPKK